jgi:hypothetical protein
MKGETKSEDASTGRGDSSEADELAVSRGPRATSARLSSAKYIMPLRMRQLRLRRSATRLYLRPVRCLTCAAMSNVLLKNATPTALRSPESVHLL